MGCGQRGWGVTGAEGADSGEGGDTGLYVRSGLCLVKCKQAAPGRSAGGTWLQASSSCGSARVTNTTKAAGHGSGGAQCLTGW